MSDLSNQPIEELHLTGGSRNMKVYVLTTGMYDTRNVGGIFATPKLAMAYWQKQTKPNTTYGTEGRSCTWSQDDDGTGWTFDADWDAYATVHEAEVKGSPTG